MKKFAVLALAAVTALTGFTPAGALPLGPVTAGQAKGSLVQEVQYRGHDDRWERRHDRRDRRDRWDRRDRRDDRRGWYNGHRGYSHSRPGYRRHSDGYWYPLAALGAAAIIGGVIANQPRPAPAQPVVNPRHVADCSARYRSYRSYDNTYQPVNGPRQQCYSAWY
ncbi:BA14K family protein [Agrobacterium rubi]|nr:BA14K family protein [Agrobacterium rubi]NTF23738.1 BA14K family protein [Agrobacterium rubi]